MSVPDSGGVPESIDGLAAVRHRAKYRPLRESYFGKQGISEYGHYKRITRLWMLPAWRPEIHLPGAVNHTPATLPHEKVLDCGRR